MNSPKSTVNLLGMRSSDEASEFAAIQKRQKKDVLCQVNESVIRPLNETGKNYFQLFPRCCFGP